MKARDIETYPKYKENPFLRHTAEISTTGWKPAYANPDGGIAVLSAGGEIHGAAVIYRQEVDKSEFVKVYSEGIGAILGLAGAGKKVFLLIYNQLYGGKNIGKTIVNLNWAELNDEDQKQISRTTMWRGINQCLEAGIIARTMTNGNYYINPAFVFNGNRLTLVHEYIAREEQRADIADQAALEAVKNQDVSK